MTWSYATLAHNPGPGFMDAMASHAVAHIGSYSPQNLANTAWAFATLTYPHRELFSAIAGAQQLPQHLLLVLRIPYVHVNAVLWAR